MDIEIKFKSITKRWLLEVFLPIAVIVALLALILCFTVRSLYIEKVRTAADEYLQGFTVLGNTDEDYFESAAKEYIEQFEHKDKMEVQVLDKNGRIIISTTGFEPSDKQPSDYEAAVRSETLTAYKIGRTSSGERVLSETTVLSGFGDSSNGAVRYTVSLKKCYMMITSINLIIIAVALGILLFTGLSGLFFIKSIAIPVRNVSAAARQLAAGNFKEKLAVKRDDEIGELCDSLNFMAAELVEAEKMKNDFISSVSHELRTPLTAIRGWGETAKMSLGNNEELVARGLDVVLSESDRLSNLVEELLDFSRLQSGRLSYNMRVFSVSDVLFEAVGMYTELARRNGIELTYLKPLKDSFVNGDPDRLKQVFINVIDNAVKYTVNSGQVLIEQIEEDACVRITVKDTGVGIPAQDIDRVKEKFFKSNKTVRGSGIGLAVADEIIKQHDGLLFIESTEGVGTTVTIVLPITEPLDEETERTVPPESAEDRKEP